MQTDRDEDDGGDDDHHWQRLDRRTFRPRSANRRVFWSQLGRDVDVNMKLNNWPTLQLYVRSASSSLVPASDWRNFSPPCEAKAGQICIRLARLNKLMIIIMASDDLMYLGRPMRATLEVGMIFSRWPRNRTWLAGWLAGRLVSGRRQLLASRCLPGQPSVQMARQEAGDDDGVQAD